MVESIQSSDRIVSSAVLERPIRVLHVDDDPAFLKVAKQCLEMQGEIDVDTVSSVIEASEKLKKTDYDAIVCDYQMPGKDGLEFLKELREKGNTVPFIVFTGKGREEIVVKALNLGADRYIDKHGDPETVYCELAHSVRVAGEQKKAEEALSAERDRLETVTKNVGARLAIISKDYHTLWANDVLKQIFGDPEGKICYSTYNQRNDVCPGCGVQEILETGKAKVVHEQVEKDVDGKTIWSEITATPVEDRDGNITAVLELVVPITERKRIEEALEESEERLRNIIENSSDQIFMLDRDCRFLSINKAAAALFRMSPQEMVGRSISEKFPETIAAKFSRNIKNVFDTGKSMFTDEKMVVKGRESYNSTSLNPVKDDRGRVIAVTGIVRDITERKKAQEDLRNSEEYLSVLFELAPDAYYLNDLKGNFIDGNKAAEEVTGYTKNELIGKSFLKLKLLPRSQALKAAKLLAMNALGKSTGPDEFVLNRKDGTQVSVEIRTHPVKIKNKTLVLGIARDITIRKKDEQALKESQQKFEGLFRHNPEAAVYLDLDSKVLDVNPRFCELFGYSAKEVEGKQINEVVVPEDMIEEAETLDKDAKKGYASHDTVRKRKDGSLVHVSISASPVTVEGRLLGYVGVYKDITALKNAEERLKKTNERLEITNEKLHVVGGLTRHDVRNKLSAVTGNAYLLKRKLTEDPEALEQLTDMEAAVRLVERIFEFAKVYERLGVEQLASMDVGKAVDEAVSLFSDLKGVKIVNECGGLTVLADSLLNQLFYNLVDNSLKYGEKIRQIKIHYRTPSADQLELVYEDDGVGIPGNMRSNLFKEGFTSGKGTGYGLFMIKRICEVYGWTIQETGKQGKGAQFTMLIPRIGSTGKANYQIQNPRQH